MHLVLEWHCDCSNQTDTQVSYIILFSPDIYPYVVDWATNTNCFFLSVFLCYFVSNMMATRDNLKSVAIIA